MQYPEVVRVFATTQEPDFECPWQAKPPRSATGSGVVLPGGRILTGAHVVANGTFLQVQKQSHPDKAVARVHAISHDADLAVLEIVEPADFLADIEPAHIGTMPKLRDQVAVVGYPVGGEEISITEGVVSRIEVQRYSHSQRYLLAVTVDAAINSGNSGGPVFGGGKVVGIAFQKLSGADNIGEMVPPPVIETFLAGIDAGHPAALPAIGIMTQNLENPHLRTAMGMPPGASGVLILGVEPNSAADGVICERDVLTHIAGLPIANNGTVPYRGEFRTRFDVMLGEHYVGSALPVRVLRQGQPLDLTLTLRTAAPLVLHTTYDQSPKFFVYGGLVFQTLTRDYLTTWDEWWNKAPKEFLNLYYFGHPSRERTEVVILSQVLADDVNQGYGHLYNESIVAINDVMPRDMADFVARLEAAHGTVTLRTQTGGLIALDTAAVKEATPRILRRYRVSADRHIG